MTTTAYFPSEEQEQIERWHHFEAIVLDVQGVELGETQRGSEMLKLKEVPRDGSDYSPAYTTFRPHKDFVNVIRAYTDKSPYRCQALVRVEFKPTPDGTGYYRNWLVCDGVFPAGTYKSTKNDKLTEEEYRDRTQRLDLYTLIQGDASEQPQPEEDDDQAKIAAAAKIGMEAYYTAEGELKFRPMSS